MVETKVNQLVFALLASLSALKGWLEARAEQGTWRSMSLEAGTLRDRMQCIIELVVFVNYKFECFGPELEFVTSDHMPRWALVGRVNT